MYSASPRPSLALMAAAAGSATWLHFREDKSSLTGVPQKSLCHKPCNLQSITAFVLTRPRVSPSECSPALSHAAGAALESVSGSFSPGCSQGQEGPCHVHTEWPPSGAINLASLRSQARRRETSPERLPQSFPVDCQGGTPSGGFGEKQRTRASRVSFAPVGSPPFDRETRLTSAGISVFSVFRGDRDGRFGANLAIVAHPLAYLLILNLGCI